MDLTSLMGAMLSGDSVENIGRAAGADAGDVKKVLGAALPSLLNGALAQSEGSDTAEGFAGALSRHAGSDLGSLGAFLEGVDMKDGSKIVAHLLGSDTDAAVKEISRKAGVSTADTGNILSAAAPLLMSLLGKETGSQQQTGSSAVAGILGTLIKNADMGSILTSLLGAGGGASDSGKDDKKDDKKTDGLLGLLGGLLK